MATPWAARDQALDGVDGRRKLNEALLAPTEKCLLLFLIENIVTTSKALVTSSDALVPSSLLFLIWRSRFRYTCDIV